MTRHLEDVRSTGRVEHIGPVKEAGERLAVLAVGSRWTPAGNGYFCCPCE